MAATTFGRRSTCHSNATGDYRNPYTEVEVWVDLEGPGFDKRIPTASGMAARTSSCGSWPRGPAHGPGPAAAPRRQRPRRQDRHLRGAAVERTRASRNPNRRGMVGATPDGRGLRYADGTPFFLLGDTWWSVPSFSFPLPKPTRRIRSPAPRSTITPTIAGSRASTGWHVAMHPAWANDGHRAAADGGRHLRARRLEAAGHGHRQGHAQ